MSSKKLCTECEFKNRPYSEYPCYTCTNNQIISELKRERDNLLLKYRDGEADEYNRGANDMLEEIIEHIDNRILEMKGEKQ